MAFLYKKIAVTVFLLSSIICQAQITKDQDEDIVFDITAYEPMRNRAIDAVHKKELIKAKSILDSCYAVNNLDTMVITLLHETLIMQINKQKNPSKNLNDIWTWEKQYPFLKEDQRIQKIKVKDAVHLGMDAFDQKNLTKAEELSLYITKTIKASLFKEELKKVANVDALLYNVGLQLFYDKRFAKAHAILAIGNELFPHDNNMNTMFKLSKERIATKK